MGPFPLLPQRFRGQKTYIKMFSELTFEASLLGLLMATFSLGFDFEKSLPCCSGWPRTHNIEEADLRFTEIHPPIFAFKGLGVKCMPPCLSCSWFLYRFVFGLTEYQVSFLIRMLVILD